MEVGKCGDSDNEESFLGGHCLLNSSVTKRFEGLPPHNKLRITSTIHLFDNWEGENIFIQVDGGKTSSRISIEFRLIGIFSMEQKRNSE